jgi:hypothetical protein
VWGGDRTFEEGTEAYSVIVADTVGVAESLLFGFFCYVVKICVDISLFGGVGALLIGFSLEFNGIIEGGKNKSAVTEWT